MRKILSITAVLFMMMSCSGDDSNDDSESTKTGTKLIKITTTSSESSSISNLTFNYDGNKLTEIKSNDSKAVITYTGDLITERKTFNADNQLTGKDIYQYNSQNQLVTRYKLWYNAEFGNGMYKTTYVHNPDEAISFTEYYSEDVDDLNSFTEIYATGTITDTTILTTFHGTDEFTNVYTYTFDGKNNPMKTITGMDKIVFANTMGSKKFNTENEVSKSSSQNGGPSVWESTTVYTYNAANYPLTQTTMRVGSVTSTQYFYE